MTIWVAVIIACTQADAWSCQSLVKPTAFYSERTCLEDVDGALDYLGKQGILSTGHCVAVDIGEKA